MGCATFDAAHVLRGDLEKYQLLTEDGLAVLTAALRAESFETTLLRRCIAWAETRGQEDSVTAWLEEEMEADEKLSERKVTERDRATETQADV
jgi:ferritin-like metal-binding protein YciE